MLSCVVKWCKNNSKSQNKGQGITFHRFPVDIEEWNDEWISLIRKCRGEDNWIPSEDSVICSIHFDEEDLYLSDNGLRCVAKFAIPKFPKSEPQALPEDVRDNSNIPFQGVSQNQQQGISTAPFGLASKLVPLQQMKLEQEDLQERQVTGVNESKYLQDVNYQQSLPTSGLASQVPVRQLKLEPLDIKEEVPEDNSFGDEINHEVPIITPSSSASQMVPTQQLKLEPLDIKQELPEDKSISFQDKSEHELPSTTTSNSASQMVSTPQVPPIQEGKNNCEQTFFLVQPVNQTFVGGQIMYLELPQAPTAQGIMTNIGYPQNTLNTNIQHTTNGVMKNIGYTKNTLNTNMQHAANGVMTNIGYPQNTLNTNIQHTTNGVMTNIGYPQNTLNTNIQQTTNGVMTNIGYPQNTLNTNLQHTTNGVMTNIGYPKNTLNTNIQQTTNGVMTNIGYPQNTLNTNIQHTTNGVMTNIGYTKNTLNTNIQQTTNGVMTNIGYPQNTLNTNLQHTTNGVMKNIGYPKNTLNTNIQQTTNGVMTDIGYTQNTLNTNMQFPRQVKMLYNGYPETPSETIYKLQQLLRKKEGLMKLEKKKMRSLNRSIRLLKDRNKFLRVKIKNLQQLKFVDTNLRLNENIAAADLFKNYYATKKLKKGIKYTDAIKDFCVKLNSHSTKAYSYIRETFDYCLPPRSTVNSWHRLLKSKESLQQSESEASN